MEELLTEIFCDDCQRYTFVMVDQQKDTFIGDNLWGTRQLLYCSICLKEIARLRQPDMITKPIAKKEKVGSEG